MSSSGFSGGCKTIRSATRCHNWKQRPDKSRRVIRHFYLFTRSIKNSLGGLSIDVLSSKSRLNTFLKIFIKWRNVVIPSKHLILEYLNIVIGKKKWVWKVLNPFLVISVVVYLLLETTKLCIVLEFYLAGIRGWGTRLYVLLSPSSFSFSSLQFHELQSKDL